MSTPDEKYDVVEGTVMLSGTEAIARLPLEQRQRDLRMGLHTGGFICGYRGSPLGTYDLELWRIQERLAAANVRFQPGINEDLAATAVWGTQYVNLYPGAKVDGVFGIWYGKTPGVERSADALHHANTAGTSPTGGVLALAGDDHAAKSSSRTGQSELQLKSSGIPILYPSNVQEILDYGLHGIAMSRFSGCWIALKLATDVVETSSEVRVGAMPRVQLPVIAEPPGGLYIRANEPPQEMEARLHEHKLPAAVAYARANSINRIEIDAPNARVGIISAGKSWGDVRGALAMLGLDDDDAVAATGIRLLKIGMTWPLDPEILARFAHGLERILVVEEKISFLEEQVKALLFDSPAAGRVRVVGKTVKPGDGGLPLAGEMSPQVVAQAIAALAGVPPSSTTALQEAPAGSVRMPNFCSGCPHNTSTVVPEGSRAMAGIGCHGMAMWIRPDSTGTITHMGGEGMLWVGQSPFTEEKHVFVNIGDGTFFHSGSLALRQAVAAKTRMTYKVLFNGYVSMTGGQPHDGDLTVQKVIDIARAEGVGSPCGPAASSMTCSESCASSRACRCLCMTKPVRPRCGGSARRIPSSTFLSGRGSILRCAKVAAIAASSPTVCRLSRLKPSWAASAASTSPRATRIFHACRGSAPASSRCTEGGCGARRGRRPRRAWRCPCLHCRLSSAATTWSSPASAGPAS